MLIAAELTTPEVMVAAVACVSLGSNAEAHAEPPVVVNCACAYELLPALQLVLTLQSYTVPAVNPDMATETAVVAVAAFVHVPDAVVL